MEKIVLCVNGMSCSHCEKAVIKAVSSLSGVSKVGIDLMAKTVYCRISGRICGAC